LLSVQLAFSTNARAYIDSERPNFPHSLPHILRLQSSSQKEWDFNLLSNLTTQSPIVPPPSSTKFFNRELRVPGIEQNGVNLRRHRDRLFDRLLPGHMHDLHNRNPRQLPAEIFI